MQKVANFIVKQKNIIFITILLITIICAFMIPKVTVNYDLKEYLPEDADVSQGLNKMDEHFELLDNVQVMVKDIQEEDCAKISTLLAGIEGVKKVDFDANSEQYYHKDKALFSLTIGDDIETEKILDTVRHELKDYQVSIGGSAVNSLDMNQTLENEMPIFLGIAALLILLILLIISNSWIEPFLFLGVSLMAIIINYGTNIMFSSVSFVTFAIAALLQLALSMDYSIMLLDQFHHEEQDKPKEEAMAKAWRKSFSAISSSSLTTIFGLLAMLFMSFTIGRDLGIVLAKGILINVLVVFLAFPSLILIFDKILNRTRKKALKIPIRNLSKFGFKGRYIITIVIVLLTVGAYFVQSNMKFTYSLDNSSKESKEIFDTFGANNQFILLYKDEGVEKASKVLSFVENYEIDGQRIVNSVIDNYNSIALPVSTEQVSEMTNLDQRLVAQVYQLYNAKQQSSVSTIPLNTLLTFLSDDVMKNEQFASLVNEETAQKLLEAKKTLEQSQKLLVSKAYNRMILTINAKVESKEASQFYQDFNQFAKDNLQESYLLGETALANNIEDSFAPETLLITVITIVSMLIIIAATYRSIGLPIVLVTLIQSAIWISLCYPVVTDSPLFFLAYIIVQCIQMGATIDYAILLSSNYMNNRQKQSRFEAIQNALKASIMTIFTSASILIAATFTIAFISSQEMISSICMVIGRGTIISVLMVLIVLPACLLLTDKLLEKTTWKKKFVKEDK